MKNDQIGFDLIFFKLIIIYTFNALMYEHNTQLVLKNIKLLKIKINFRFINGIKIIKFAMRE